MGHKGNKRFACRTKDPSLSHHCKTESSVPSDREPCPRGLYFSKHHLFHLCIVKRDQFLFLQMIGEEVATTGDPKLNSTFGLRESSAAGTCTISPLCPCLPANPDPVPTAEKSDRRQRRAWPAQDARRAGGRRAAATPAPPRGRGPTPPASPARAGTRRCSLSPQAQIQLVKATALTSPGPGRERRRPEEAARAARRASPAHRCG